MVVIDKVVSYDLHIVGLVLHNVPVVDIALGTPLLANIVHDLALDIHLFDHRFFGMKSVASMHDTLVEFDILVLVVVGTVDTLEVFLLCVGVVFGQAR